MASGDRPSKPQREQQPWRVICIGQLHVELHNLIVLIQTRFKTVLIWLAPSSLILGDRFLSSASTGKHCALSMMFPDCSPVLDKNRAPMGPEILSSTGAGAWRKAPMAFPDSSSVLDKFQSATYCTTSSHVDSRKGMVDLSSEMTACIIIIIKYLVKIGTGHSWNPNEHQFH